MSREEKPFENGFQAALKPLGKRAKSRVSSAFNALGLGPQMARLLSGLLPAGLERFQGLDPFGGLGV